MEIKYNVIGLMSGTSLDGLDIAYCEFSENNGIWRWKLGAAQTIPYPQDLSVRLRKGNEATGIELATLDIELGRWIGKHLDDFISNNNLLIDVIASHGHTIFHQPEKGLTLQIGNGNVISAITGLPVVYDFRSLDVALGGQGAPLVPVGDKLLFPEYDICLNLGGIANLSFEKEGKRLAYDICPCNMVLNYVAGIVHRDYDKDGEMAKKGVTIQPLLDKLDRLDFYNMPYPKSLGIEWVQENIFPLMKEHTASPNNLMRTLVDHIGNQIERSVRTLSTNKLKMLVTGGGALNLSLIDLLEKKLSGTVEVILPEQNVIDFKEAIVFGFLGVLRVRSEVNCLAEVTGARKDSCGGIIAGGF